MNIDNQSKTHRKSFQRTLGDGMDNSLINLKQNELKLNNTKIHIDLSKSTLSFKPVEPDTEVFHLVPKYIPKERKQPKCLIKKPKEPKFVPYEPYKGAIEPILPHKSAQKIIEKKSRNNVEIQELVNQMTEIRISELSKAQAEAIKNDETLLSVKQWQKEKQAYETDIKNLRETNAHLENQIKFQSQVNSELKTLLVAAVGEDLETRVQHLTEDKLQLARALLKSANHLTSHQEQTEWLSGQCEVWRSKFLASSLMVEELARWKSALTNRIQDLQDTMRGLLDNERKLQRSTLKLYCHLNSILSTCTQEEPKQMMQGLSHLDLCTKSCAIAETICDQLKIDKQICSEFVKDEMNSTHHTLHERNALKLLQNPVVITNKQDAICNALMGAAVSLSGDSMYLQHPTSRLTCCAHCKGEVEDV